MTFDIVKGAVGGSRVFSVMSSIEKLALVLWHYLHTFLIKSLSCQDYSYFLQVRQQANGLIYKFHLLGYNLDYYTVNSDSILSNAKLESVFYVFYPKEEGRQLELSRPN